MELARRVPPSSCRPIRLGLRRHVGREERSFRNLAIERIAYYELDGGLMASEAKLFGLFRSDQ